MTLPQATSSDKESVNDNGYANYLVLIQLICHHMQQYYMTTAIDFDYAEDLARNLADRIPSQVLLDREMSVQEVLAWTERKEAASAETETIRPTDHWPVLSPWLVVFPIIIILLAWILS